MVMLHMRKVPLTGEAHVLPLRNAYFLDLARRVRFCPACGSITKWEGTHCDDYAVESCLTCGWFKTRKVPESLRTHGVRLLSSEVPRHGARRSPACDGILEFRRRNIA